MAARAEDFALLREEARRRGVPLATVLGEAVAAAASRLRESRRPRYGVGRSGVGAARVSGERPDEPLESSDFRG